MWFETMHRCTTAQDTPGRIFELLERYFLEAHQFRFVPTVIQFHCGYGDRAHGSDEETPED
jgi:hypothetical protein